MLAWKSISLILPLALASNTLARRLVTARPSVPIVPVPDGPFQDRAGNTLPPINTTYFFDQLIDHNNPRLGTFKQRFWSTWEFYEPGKHFTDDPD